MWIYIISNIISHIQFGCQLFIVNLAIYLINFFIVNFQPKTLYSLILEFHIYSESVMNVQINMIRLD